jgi:hypothetical protein
MASVQHGPSDVVRFSWFAEDISRPQEPQSRLAPETEQALFSKSFAPHDGGTLPCGRKMDDLIKHAPTCRLTAGLTERLWLAEESFRLIKPDLPQFVFTDVSHRTTQDARRKAHAPIPTFSVYKRNLAAPAAVIVPRPVAQLTPQSNRCTTHVFVVARVLLPVSSQLGNLCPE